mgnify:CR=1 FL=1
MSFRACREISCFKEKCPLILRGIWTFKGYFSNSLGATDALRTLIDLGTCSIFSRQEIPRQVRLYLAVILE